MAKKKKPTDKPKSGGARLVASGKKPILLGVTPEQYEKISTAAKADNRPITQYIIHHILKEAEKYFKNLSKKT